MECLGQLAIAEQAGVLKQRYRTVDELIEKVVDPMSQCLPIACQAMQFENVLPKPTPELLNRVEPWGVGWKPYRLYLWVGRKCLQHVVMLRLQRRQLQYLRQLGTARSHERLRFLRYHRR